MSDEIDGMYLARDVRDGDARTVLVRRGTRLTVPLIRAMRRRGVVSAWVTDDLLPDLEVDEVVSEHTRAVTRKALESALHSVGRGGRQLTKSLEQVKEAVLAVVDEILSDREVVANINQLRAWDDYTFEHSVQVAIVSILIGRELGLDRERLHRLGTGAILHDIGKVAVPRAILEKPGPLTPEEFEVVKTHCRVGWDLIQDHPTVMPTSSIVILQHHERLDGSGYPSGLEGDAIHLHARIAAVADVFDALRADRSYRRRLDPPQIVRILEGDAAAGKLDERCVRSLFRRVALVPQGEIVRLTDGYIGVVTAHNPGFPLQPVVTIVADGEGRIVEQAEVDLKHGDVYVAEVLDGLPARACEFAGVARAAAG